MKDTELVVTRELSREGPSRIKILQALKGLTGGTRHAHAFLDQFNDLEPRLLAELVERRRGIRIEINALMIDLDATLAPAYRPILPRNLAKLDQLADQGIKLVIYSNALSTVNADRLGALQDRKIPFFTQPIAKPDPYGFRAVCAEFGLNHRTTWMVGDDPATDGGALNIHPDGEPVLGGMIFVRPIPDEKGAIKGRKRITLGIKALARTCSLFATSFRNPGLITSQDLLAARGKRP